MSLVMEEKGSIYTICIDGEWYIEELTDFLNTYLQAYYLFNSLFAKEFDINYWRGSFI